MTSRQEFRQRSATYSPNPNNNNEYNIASNSSSSAGTNNSKNSNDNNNNNSSRNNNNNNLSSRGAQMMQKKFKARLNELPAVLTQMQLRNLDEHKYSSSGSTLLDPFFQPFWRWLVEQMPMSLAPNAITSIGLFINVVTCTLLICQSPNGEDDPPAWSLILCAVGLFVYQALDAIDGKQARRTNSSTPLGELFDHGCDAVSTVFVVTALSVALRLGQWPWFMFTICFVSMSAFYTAHWQTYVTGSLKFGKVDVTEAQFTMYAIFLLTGLFGDSIWSATLPVLGVQVRFVPSLIGLAGSFSSILGNLDIISQGGKGKNGSSVAGTSIVFPLFPLGLFIFLAFSIASKSPDVYLANICLFTMAFGMVWAKFTIKLIIAHMTKGEIFLLDSCLVGPVALMLNQYFGYLVPELFVLVVCLIIATIDLLKYSSKVCLQICTHMNIYLFRIKPSPSK